MRPWVFGLLVLVLLGGGLLFAFSSESSPQQVRANVSTAHANAGAARSSGSELAPITPVQTIELNKTVVSNQSSQITLTSRPSGALVRKNGALLGTTPLELELLERDGVIAVELALTGYETVRQEIDPSRSDSSLEVRLTRVRSRSSSMRETTMRETTMESDSPFRRFN